MKVIKQSTIWRAHSKVRVDQYEDGTKVYRLCLEDGTEREVAAPPASPRTPAVHGMFKKNRPRYLSTLAPRPGDPNAFVTSYHEAERKAAAIGGEIVRIEDVADSHPVHATGNLYDKTGA